MTHKSETAFKSSSSREVYSVLYQFFQAYLVERDPIRTLSLVSEEFYSVGTGESEVAIGKKAFSALLYAEIEQLPNPIFFTLHNYKEKQILPGCWECFCTVETLISLPEGAEAMYHMRVTAGIHKEGDTSLIHTIHASEASVFQEEGEFLPLKFISQEMGALSHETQRQLMELIGQIMPGGIVGGYMEEGFPLYVANDHLLQMAGYESSEEFREDIQGLVINTVHPEDQEYVYEQMENIIHTGDQFEIDYRFRKKDGSYMWVHDIGRRTVAGDGRHALISVLIDISQQMRAKNSLEQEAVTDPLTGIYNRRGGQFYLTQAISQASSYMFFILDLDNFKLVNDIYGHKQGDQALLAVAELLTKTFRKTDVVYRLGGDEFAVFISNCKDISAMERKFKRLIASYQALTEKRWPAAASTLSAGGVYGSKKYSFSELYQQADEALYHVKNEQKGRMLLRPLD